jgi:hypothetical protein
MTRGTVALTAAAVTFASVVTGCAGPSVDASCDVEGVTHDVEHMVEEAGLVADSIDELRCSGDWSVTTVTVSGPTSEPVEERFIFLRTDAGWVLKAPEVACDDSAGLETLPADLRAGACPEQ